MVSVVGRRRRWFVTGSVVVDFLFHECLDCGGEFLCESFYFLRCVVKDGLFYHREVSFEGIHDVVILCFLKL